MLAILALTFIWAHLVGQWQHQQKPIKLKSHKRLEKSVFRVGMELVAKVAMQLLATLNYFLEPKQVLRFFVVY